MEDNENQRQPVVGMWRVARDNGEEFVGSLHLGTKPSLNFPLLRSETAVPSGTTLFWGVATRRTDPRSILPTDLNRYTVLTAPTLPCGMLYSQDKNHSYFVNPRVRAVFIGKELLNPDALRVTQIGFVPSPNNALHASTFYEYLRPDRDIVSVQFADGADETITNFANASIALYHLPLSAFVDVPVPSVGRVKAHLVNTMSANGSSQTQIRFVIEFDTPHAVWDAVEEAHTLCVFLSFISHSFVVPLQVGLRLSNDQPCGMIIPGLGGEPESAPYAHPIHTLALPDQKPANFASLLIKWYSTNESFLRSRYLNRWSLAEPGLFSNERFLTVFNAVEGLLKGMNVLRGTARSTLLSQAELSKAISAVRHVVPSSEQLNAFVVRMRNANGPTPRAAFAEEVATLLSQVGAVPFEGDVDSFVDRVFRRRNYHSHGARGTVGRFADTLSGDTLILDTLILSAIYAMLDGRIIGMDPLDAGMQFESAHGGHVLKYDAPGALPDERSRW